ncbi:hypothetical protein AAMO2058_000060100 [Amorphochlora amoebiformis]
MGASNIARKKRSGGRPHDVKAYPNAEWYLKMGSTDTDFWVMVVKDGKEGTTTNRRYRVTNMVKTATKTVEVDQKKKKLNNWFTITSKDKGKLAVRLDNWVERAEALPRSNEMACQQCTYTQKYGIDYMNSQAQPL